MNTSGILYINYITTLLYFYIPLFFLLARTSNRVLLTGQKYLLRNTQTGRLREWGGRPGLERHFLPDDIHTDRVCWHGLIPLYVVILASELEQINTVYAFRVDAHSVPNAVECLRFICAPHACKIEYNPAVSF